jgi:uncharacterized protein involved in exopolysaccharide biosynthesis
MMHTEEQEQASYSKGESVVNAEAAMARRAAVASLLVAVAVGVASLLQTPKYEASAHMLVKQVKGGQLETEDPRELQTIILTMIPAIDSRPIAEEAIRRLGLRMDPAELLDNLTVE